MDIKSIFAVVATGSALLALAAVPNVTGVTMTQTNDRLVTINYTLSDAPAVITVDVQTNDANGGWASIGGEAIWNAMGDVWKKVESGETAKTITWRPDHTWPDHKIEGNNTRAVVTAWPLENTPDYMVVDITGVPASDVVRYYPGADYLPKSSFKQAGAAITNNPAYKTTKFLMRKIMARGVEWRMGSARETGRNTTNEDPHLVTLDKNYYIGVFEVTQAQWQWITGYSYQQFTTQQTMRPYDFASYTDIRQGDGSSKYSEDGNVSAPATGGEYPAEPYSESFLGLLRTKTGIDFDLPSEAQWEFAARAGHGEGHWGDGSTMNISNEQDTNLNRISRYKKNPTGMPATPSFTVAPDEGGTAIVGSFQPNSWGLYDMTGNMLELCLDYYKVDITGLKGAVNTQVETATSHVAKGGGWSSPVASNRPAYRGGRTNKRYNIYGFRVVCTAGIK